jgi:DNA invertase Pin-like site-specific DNA recombinase
LDAFAESERAMIRERTMTGLAHARREGRQRRRRFTLNVANIYECPNPHTGGPVDDCGSLPAY